MSEVIRIDLEDEYMIGRILKLNDSYLEKFRNDLSSFSPIETGKHLMNAELFIDDFLLRSLGESVEAGAERISDFFGFEYITGYVRSTPESLKACAYSVELFYESMLRLDVIEASEMKKISDTIEANIDTWMELCRRYNDPEEENPFADRELED